MKRINLLTCVVSRKTAGTVPAVIWLVLVLLGSTMPWSGWAQSSVPAETGAPSLSRAALVEQVMPAVVNVSTVLLTQDSKARSAQGVGSRRSGSFATQHGFGSGFVIDSSGLIVTNRHVVENAVRITVTFKDQTTLPARIVGRLSRADVALLKVTSSKPLPFVTWGDSDKLRLGDDVIAIGNPLGLGGSVSAGIVSGLNRDISTTPYDEFIQTDAAINHGNSGGPLFDSRGRVVGINTAIYSPSETSGSIGISFALPSETATFIIDETLKYGRVQAGWIGARLQSVTPDIADALGLGEARGAIILSLYRDSSAAEAGLRRGDVIIQVGDHRPQDSRELLRDIAIAPLDQTLRMEVWREGKTFVAQPIVRVLASMDVSDPADALRAREPPSDPGMSLAEIDRAARQKYKLPADSNGVLVTGVSPYSPADMHGIRAGDVIVEADQHKVTRPSEVDAHIAAAQRQNLRNMLFLITGPGGDRFVTLPMHPGVEEPNPPPQPAEAEQRH